ncbi:hypothetical protein [Pelobacter seleniigenes]|uniref:hypothetical protein n=1 Tax=Pelobacter seleniigenes TaxID=407188 RepID=UPI0012B6E2A4|nr:hypothetical protein [Pelobacter seleniigenes]
MAKNLVSQSLFRAAATKRLVCWLDPSFQTRQPALRGGASPASRSVRNASINEPARQLLYNAPTENFWGIFSCITVEYIRCEAIQEIRTCMEAFYNRKRKRPAYLFASTHENNIPKSGQSVNILLSTIDDRGRPLPPQTIFEFLMTNDGLKDTAPLQFLF